MPVHYWRPLLVDRISIAVVIGSQDFYKFVYGQLFSMQEEQQQLLPGGKIKVVKNKYCMRLDYYPSYKKYNRRKIADITIGTNKLFGNNVLHRYFTLTLYPSRFQVGDFEHFKDVLEIMLDEFNYVKLYHTGKVNYLELAADSLSHKNHTFLPLRMYCKGSSIYKRQDGSLGTLYFGDVTSSMRTRIYDKRQQLLDMGQPVQHPNYPAHTRFEAVMRRLPYTPATLAKMKNPFRHVQVVDLHGAVSASSDAEWQELISIGKAVGLPKALSKQPKQRKENMAVLKHLLVPWFQPDFIWKGLTHALAVIAP